VTVVKKEYKGRYPSAARHLIDIGVASIPRQRERELKYSSGLDIIYTLHGLTPAAFREHADELMLLAFQEAKRYDEYRWKFASFDVRLGRLKKGKDLPEVASFQTAMHPDPEIMVYGPGYEVPQRHFLYHKVEDILDIVNRYPDRVSRQTPFRVVRLTISIREVA
jgi:hypothetical protein